MKVYKILLLLVFLGGFIVANAQQKTDKRTNIRKGKKMELVDAVKKMDTLISEKTSPQDALQKIKYNLKKKDYMLLKKTIDDENVLLDGKNKKVVALSKAEMKEIEAKMENNSESRNSTKDKFAWRMKIIRDSYGTPMWYYKVKINGCNGNNQGYRWVRVQYIYCW